LKEQALKSSAYTHEIAELRSSIHDLEIRASCHFQDLTPRPILQPVRSIQIFEALKEPWQKMSTVEAVEYLTQKLTALKPVEEHAIRLKTSRRNFANVIPRSDTRRATRALPE
jgi:hypothetical protein